MVVWEAYNSTRSEEKETIAGVYYITKNFTEHDRLAREPPTRRARIASHRRLRFNEYVVRATATPAHCRGC